MTSSSVPPISASADFEALIHDIRPALHRYVTRMVGSVIDAEDVVQEALVKAYSSLPLLPPDANVRGWLFRIAHNKAIDYLRRTREEVMELLDEYPAVEPDMPLEEKELATVALSAFLKLAPRQRSCVILKDVLGYSLVEISEFLNASVPEIKAALHRGRTRLRELATNVETSSLVLDEREMKMLARYVDCFNAYDFDSVRTMLADEVQLDLFGRVTLKGADEVKNRYFFNYSKVDYWRLALGFVEDRPAILVYERHSDAIEPIYFMMLTWADDHVSHIRDYMYARHVMRDAKIAAM